MPIPPPLEVIPLIVSGPSTNRVNLMFFSDGCEFVYSSSHFYFFQPFYDFRRADVTDERDKFIEDARRLAEDVSTNQTFNTVQPLLNFWAAFSPSKEVLLFLLIDKYLLNINYLSTEWDWRRRCS